VNGFDLRLSTRVRFGPGVRKLLPGLIKEEGWQKVGLVVDHNLAETAPVEELVSLVEEAVDKLIVARLTVSEPTYDDLEELRPVFDDPNLAAVVGIGGGSALDAAKAMAVLVHNQGPVLAYRGFDQMTEPVLPVVALPTTAGTGSEVTPNASFVDAQAKKKLGINGEAIRPRHALLDPELTLSCPQAPTISAGMDALVHAIEAYTAKKSNPLARLFAREGFNRVARALPNLLDDLADLDLRSEIMYGAFLAGAALMHSSAGPAAAMSYPLGVRFGVPHGLGGGIFLPHVVACNIAAGCLDYAGLASGGTEGLSPEVAARRFLDDLFVLWSRLDIPSNLEFCGLSDDDVEVFITDTMELSGALEQNPVSFGREEVEGVLACLL